MRNRLERMKENEKKYISVVPFSRLVNWSVQYLKGSGIAFNPKYPLMRIGEFLTRNKTSVTIQDGIKYKRATIKVRNGGIFLRDEVLGNKIGTKKQFLISEGQFLLSKIDARNGAFGVVPESVDGGIITGNFWTFDVDENIVNPHYLALLTTTEAFIAFCEQASNGTTNRHYLQESLFLNIEVPIPSLKEQNKLVRDFTNVMYYIQTEEDKVLDISVKATVSVREALGLHPYPGHLKESLVKVTRFKNIESWTVPQIMSMSNTPYGKSIYNCKKLSELADINPRTDLSMLNDTDKLSFIPMEDISDDYGEWFNHKTGEKSQIKGYTKFQDGDIIWARITPCMQNGKSALLNDLVNGKGYGSTEFHVIRLKTNEVLPNYIHTLLRHFDVLQDAQKYFTGYSGQQRVPASYLSNLLIPIPPLDVQQKIVDEYTQGIKVVKKGLHKIHDYWVSIKEDFEKIIFE